MTKKTQKDEERSVSFRPGRHKDPREGLVYTAAFRKVLAGARKIAQGSKRKASWGKYSQRCVIKMRYEMNRKGIRGNQGHWAAHGRYISRTDATKKELGEPCGFDQKRDDLDPKFLLDSWQKADDPRLYKFIISPEFGERVHLKKLTRDVMGRMQEDLKIQLGGARLEWVAAIHRNTDNPHVHVALRGIAGVKEYRIPQGYVRHGIRRHAQEFCTRQMGYRTRRDAELARARLVKQLERQAVEAEIKRQKGVRPKRGAERI